MGFCSWMNLSLASKRHAFQTWIGRNSKETRGGKCGNLTVLLAFTDKDYQKVKHY
jgi:hypothetical protein